MNMEGIKRLAIAVIETETGAVATLAGRIDDSRAEAAGAGLRRFERVLRELRPRDGHRHRLSVQLTKHRLGIEGVDMRDTA